MTFRGIFNTQRRPIDSRASIMAQPWQNLAISAVVITAIVGTASFDLPPRGTARGAALTAQPIGSPDNLTVLVGQDTFFDGPGRAPVYDYPNPTLTKYTLARFVSQPDGSSLNVTTLLSQDAMTLFRFDFKNPVLRVSYVPAINAQSGVWTNRTVIYPLPVGAPPSFVWPNPRGPGYRLTAIRGADWVNRLPTLLKGQDRFYDGPGLAPTFDYPNPIAPRRTITLRTITSGPLNLIPGPPILGDHCIEPVTGAIANTTMAASGIIGNGLVPCEATISNQVPVQAVIINTTMAASGAVTNEIVAVQADLC